MVECGYKLGGEQSGHMIFTDYATTGDGQLSALQFLQILALSGKSASVLTADCPQYPQVLLNVVVSHDRGVKEAIMASDALKTAVADEEKFLRGKMIADTDVGVFSYFFTGGLNLALIALCLLSLIWGIYSEVK